MSEQTFSAGFIFYHWDKYNNKAIDHQYYYSNKVDHGGNKEYELYVKKKHQSLKEELLYAPEHSLSSYQFMLT